MNDLGAVLVVAVGKSTVLAIAALVMVRLLRRGRPALGAQLALVGLAGMSLTLALAIAPWPRSWTWTISPPERVRADPPRRRAVEVAANDADQGMKLGRKPGEPAKERLSLQPLGRSLPVLVRRLSSQVRFPSHSWRLSAWIGIAWTVLVATGLARFCAGLWGLKRLRARSLPIDDARIRELAEELCSEYAIRRTIAVCESSRVDSPATLGWLRPVVLLPCDWIDWSSAELRAALAHELAHAKANDSALRLMARFCLIWHAYHPLAYALYAGLCLDQELAADSSAVRLSGGRQAYVGAIARLALRTIGRARLWASPALFRSRGILLRRLAMLKRDAAVRPAGEARGTNLWSKWTFTFALGALTGAACLLASLRGPGTKAWAQAEDHARASSIARPFKLETYLPANAAFVIAARPAALAGSTEIKVILDDLRRKSPEEFGRFFDVVDPESIDAIALAVLPSVDAGALKNPEKLLFDSGGVVVHTKRQRDWKTFAALAGLTIETIARDGDSIMRLAVDGVVIDVFMPDPNTLIAASSRNLQTFLEAYRARETSPRNRSAWELLDREGVCCAIDIKWAKSVFAAVCPPQELAELNLYGSAFAPIWEQSDRLALSLRFVDGLELEIAATCKDEIAGDRVEKTLAAVVTLVSNSLPKLGEFLRSQAGGEEAQLAAPLTKAGEDLFRSAKVDRSAGEVRLRAKAGIDSSQLIKLIPASL